MKMNLLGNMYKCCACKKEYEQVLLIYTSGREDRYCEDCVSKALASQYKEESVDEKIIIEIDRFISRNRKRPENLYLGVRQLCELGLATDLDNKTYLGLRVFCLRTVKSHIAVS